MAELFEIEIDGGRKVFAPDEEMVVRARWTLSRNPREMEAHLLFYTSGKGTEDTQLFDSLPIQNPQMTGDQTLRFRLPLYPYSFSGRLISLIWAVELIALPGDYVARVEFTLAPAGQEIRLEKVADDNPLKKMLGRGSRLEE